MPSFVKNLLSTGMFKLCGNDVDVESVSKFCIGGKILLSDVMGVLGIQIEYVQSSHTGEGIVHRVVAALGSIC